MEGRCDEDNNLQMFDSIVMMNSSFLLSNICSHCNEICPRGGAWCLPIILSFWAMTCALIAAIGCDFYEISYQDNYTDYTDYLGVGLWSVESHNGTCTKWEEYTSPLSLDDLDGAMKTARAFGMASVVLSSLASFIIFFPCCCGYTKNDTGCYFMTLTWISIFSVIATSFEFVSEHP